MEDKAPDPFPRLTPDQALAVVSDWTLPAFPTGTPLTWEDAKAVYSWASAVLAVWGEASQVFIQNVLSDAVRNSDMRAFQGWSVIQLALSDFARVPGDNDIVH